MNTLQEILKIAEIHAKRIAYAMDRLSKLFPISPSAVENISEQDFLFIELLTTRFSKLQDFIGAKLVDAFLDSQGELTYNMTMIDKINKLERLAIIDDATLWSRMREVRNHLAHEYPDHPEITAKYLNQVFELAPQLLTFLKNIKQKIKV